MEKTQGLTQLASGFLVYLIVSLSARIKAKAYQR